MAYNPQVAKALGSMGIDPKKKEKLELENRPRVSPKVASVLEALGVRYKEDQIQGNTINEEGTNPLDMPGKEPIFNDKNSGMKPKPGQQQPGKPQNQQQQKKPEPAQVKLKRPTTQMKTLQDISDKMTEVTANIKTVDLLIQALTENKSSDNKIDSHKLTLQGPIQAVVNAVMDLKKLVE